MCKKKIYNDDDNRVIAPMNVEGMPWHQKGSKPQNSENKQIEPLTKKETFSVVMNAILAGLAIALIMGLAGFLFIYSFSHYFSFLLKNIRYFFTKLFITPKSK